MARPRSETRRDALLEATVAEVVERGLDAASVAGIAGRAGTAVGSVYRYFDGKETLLRESYLSVKRRVHARLVEAVRSRSEPRESMEAAWHALVDLAADRPRDFAFTATLAARGLPDGAHRRELEAMGAELRALLVRAAGDTEVSPDALVALFVAPAMQLAHDAAAAGRAPDPTLARELFSLVWRGLHPSDQ